MTSHDPQRPPCVPTHTPTRTPTLTLRQPAACTLRCLGRPGAGVPAGRRDRLLAAGRLRPGPLRRRHHRRGRGRLRSAPRGACAWCQALPRDNLRWTVLRGCVRYGGSLPHAVFSARADGCRCTVADMCHEDRATCQYTIDGALHAAMTNRATNQARAGAHSWTPQVPNRGLDTFRPSTLRLKDTPVTASPTPGLKGAGGGRRRGCRDTLATPST